MFANHVGFSKLQAQLVNFIFKSTFTLFLISNRTPANRFVVSLVSCFIVVDSFGLIFRSPYLTQASSFASSFFSKARYLQNYFSQQRKLTSYLLFSFVLLWSLFKRRCRSHTWIQNGTNYFETPNNFWDLVVHADKGWGRAQPCEEQSVKVGFRLGHPAHFLGIHPPRDRLREALYEEGELGMILTFSEDSLTCCLQLPVLDSCPYHRLCLWWPRSRTSSCSSSSVILARFSLFSRSKELCRARRFPSTRAIFRFTSFSCHKKYCAEV